MLNTPIYLDHHATTKPDPRVLDAIWPYFTEKFGNAASLSHRFGWEASDAVDLARGRVADVIGAESREIVFTSGATESNNLAIKGAAWALEKKGRHLVSATTEHRAVLDPLRRLERAGWGLTLVEPDEYGMIHAAAVAEAIRDDTVLVSVMAANNEVGTINPIAEIGRICSERGVVFHTDATQAVGKIAIDVAADGIGLLSLSAHKMYGPKGIGALYVRRRERPVRLTPLFDGGGHESGVRSGTPAVPLIVGLGAACEIARAEWQSESTRVLELRERLHAAIVRGVPNVRLNGHPTARLAANLNLSFPGVDGEALMMAMREVAVSSGAACSSAEPEPSHVLLAIGLDEDLARASLRFGLGRWTTAEEVDYAAQAVAAAVRRLTSLPSTWSSRK
ncbi:MAG: aminotransferase class V-fold PLP-dependent enzyme [Isosphaeraceae bacterium]|nr:aminotransferase class V-fold PLP-dependent enzyme [Isosphaeraceae bacterium]